MTKINSLDDIVKNSLCIGCGLCKSIAGNSIEMEMSDKGNLEPKELTPITNETLDEIKKVCPGVIAEGPEDHKDCLLYTSPSPRDYAASRMPSSA